MSATNLKRRIDNVSPSPALPERYKARLLELVAFLQTEEKHDVTVTWDITERRATFTRFDKNSKPMWHLRLHKPTLDDNSNQAIQRALAMLGWKEYLNDLPVGGVVLLVGHGQNLTLERA